MGHDRGFEKKFFFIGNHPCLDFINTRIVQNGQPVDLLETFLDFVAWLGEGRLLNREEVEQAELKWGGKPVGMLTLDQAREFRDSLRGMVERIATDKPVPSAAIEAINRMLRYRVGYPQLARRKGKFEREFRGESQEANQLLGLLAESASDLLCTCNFSFIKQCQNPPCVLFFYDTTKNHARHWCSMNVCGNQNKVAAHYRRHREHHKFGGRTGSSRGI
jgi:predicted RNA-binding Zn ribbon-like protein